MICPLARAYNMGKFGKKQGNPDCLTEHCAWWDKADYCCCLVSIKMELTRLGEKNER